MFKFLSYIFILISILCCFLGVEAQSEEPSKPRFDTSVQAFGQLPLISSIEISPDGKRIAILQNFRGRKTLITRSLENLSEPPHIIPFSVGEFNWAIWASNDRLLVSLRFAGKRYGTETMETRMLSFLWNGKEIVSLAKKAHGGKKLGSNLPKKTIPLQIQDRVIDSLPDDLEHIFVSLNDEDHSKWNVYRVNIETGKYKRIQRGRVNIQDWYTDHHHKIRYGEGTKEVMGGKVFNYAYYRKTKEEEWKQLYRYDSMVEGSPFDFIGFSSDADIIYVSKVGDNSRKEFYRYDTRNGKFKNKIAVNQKFDIESINIDENGDILGYFYYDTKPVYVSLEKKEQGLQRFYKKNFPGASVMQEAISKDRKIRILRVSSPKQPAEFYVLNLKKKTLNILGYNYSSLDVSKLADMKPITYKARDGLEISGYLSLPVGKDAKNLPTVILPHGGPFARDNWGFDYWVQFLTTRGYAVLQMNFRGSTGYGANFQSMGNHQWAGKMLEDINDGTKWMIKEGTADPKRICIMGASYGGYAALQAIVKDQSLYKCSVSFAPVTDLEMFVKEKKKFTFSRKYIDYVKSNKWTLEEGSPMDNLDKINVPVLLMHGEKDRRVRVRQSRILYKKMKSARKDIKYIEFKKGDHHLSREEHRLTFFTEIEKFLEKHL